MKNIGAIILAAGSSSRLGRPKQLLPFRGKPLLQHAIDCLPEGFFSTKLVVLGAHSEEIRAAVQFGGAEIFTHEGWPEGMGSSLREGARRSLELDPGLDALLVLICDQPFVSPFLMEEILETHRLEGRPITACRYAGILGVPALFSKEMFPALLVLTGDRGAGGLIKAHPGEVSAVPFELGGVDVDTEGDWAGLDEGIK